LFFYFKGEWKKRVIEEKPQEKVVPVSIPPE